VGQARKRDNSLSKRLSNYMGVARTYDRGPGVSVANIHAATSYTRIVLLFSSFEVA